MAVMIVMRMYAAQIWDGGEGPRKVAPTCFFYALKSGDDRILYGTGFGKMMLSRETRLNELPAGQKVYVVRGMSDESKKTLQTSFNKKASNIVPLSSFMPMDEKPMKSSFSSKRAA